MKKLKWHFLEYKCLYIISIVLLTLIACWIWYEYSYRFAALCQAAKRGHCEVGQLAQNRC